jgi:hypothetical protein
MYKQIKLISAVVFCLAMGVTLQGQNVLKQAEQLVSQGKYTEALLSLNNHLAKEPSDTKSFMLLAEIQTKLGRLDLACATYSLLESMNVKDESFYFAYANSLKTIGHWDEAIAKYSKCKGKKKGEAEKQIQICKMAKQLNAKEDGKKVLNLDLNSTKNDYGSIVYNDELFFNSTRNENHSLNKAMLDGAAVAPLLGVDIDNIEAISISNNNKVVFTKIEGSHTSLNDRINNGKLYTADYNGHTLENIKEFEHNIAGVSNYGGCLSTDGKYLYFSSNVKGGKGGFDLYKSIYDGKNWSSPVSVGDQINTPENEITPKYENGFLWFASNGHKGHGGYDLYSARNIGESFVQVRNLGDGINTANNETYPFVKNLSVYFTSDRAHGKGLEDIYKAPLSEKLYTYNLITVEDALVTNDKTNETPPPAYALSEVAYNERIQNIDEVLSGARRVSMKEALTTSVNGTVFFIQLASMVAEKQNMDKFKGLVQFGNIYKVRVNNTNKLRLGYFLDKSETQTMLNKVRNSGFKDAFIVEQDLNTAELELMLSQASSQSHHLSAPNEVSKPQNTASVNKPSYSAPPVYGNRQYKVRLGAYEDPIWFDTNKVKDLGKLEQWTKGAWTIFILGGYENMNKAEEARIAAVNRGYPDAEVVIDNAGIIERLKKN